MNYHLAAIDIETKKQNLFAVGDNGDSNQMAHLQNLGFNNFVKSFLLNAIFASSFYGSMLKTFPSTKLSSLAKCITAFLTVIVLPILIICALNYLSSISG